MSIQPPTKFDNYPSEVDPAASGFGESSDDLEPPARRSRPQSRVLRRTVVGVLVGIPVASLGLAAISQRSSRPVPVSDPSPTEPSASQSSGSDPDASSPEPESPTPSYASKVNVGGYSATVPKGWRIDDNRADEVALSKGTNRVIAFHFPAVEEDMPKDLIGPLTRRRLGAFKGKLHLDQVGESEHSYRYSEVWADGVVGRRKASLYAALWITWDENDALLVIKILTAPSGSDAIREADGIMREFALSFPW